MTNKDNSQSTNYKAPITIIGAGPVGSLLSIFLCKLGYKVNVYEKRPDSRLVHNTEGRSINIALSHRGIRALREAGIEDITSIAVPMKGRMIHNINETLSFQPYGEEGQMIYSVSRNQLNEIIINEAERSGAKFHFNIPSEYVDIETGIASFKQYNKKITTDPSLIFGADGAFSSVRNSLKNSPHFFFEQKSLSHGYKELNIPASSGKHVMEKSALHIWPRAQFMLIALPNSDGSFTATLFLPFEGNYSFDTFKTESDVKSFFEKFFPNAIKVMPALIDDFFKKEASSLTTVHCYPWIYKDKVALIGDAAHAITPFYGQGMNAGFEDCRILNNIISSNNHNWRIILNEYQQERKENADAIADLALQNFIEMRDLVGDENFILRKKIEAKIHTKEPTYLPLYSMVTFSDTPYKEALIKGKEHDLLMQAILKVKNIEEIWDTEDGWKEIEKILIRFQKK